MIVGYLILSRLYLIETNVFRNALLNVILVPAGCVAFGRFVSGTELKRLSTVLVAIGLLGMVVAGIIGSL